MTKVFNNDNLDRFILVDTTDKEILEKVQVLFDMTDCYTAYIDSYTQQKEAERKNKLYIDKIQELVSVDLEGSSLPAFTKY